jgi:hypothetical protein
VRSGWSGGLGHGHHTSAGAPEGAADGEAGYRWRGSTPASNHVGKRAVTAELRAWAGCSPRVRTLENLEDGGVAMELRIDGGGAPDAQQMLR